jgi:hypothetical protein
MTAYGLIGLLSKVKIASRCWPIREVPHMTRFRFLTALVTMILIASLANQVPAQENVMGPSGVSKSSGRAELQRLKFYLGDWDYSEVLPKSALSPNGGRNTGRWTAQMGPQGRSIILAFVSQGSEPYEGIEVMTWDPEQKVYRDHSLWYNSADHVSYVGHFEGDALVYRSEFERDGKHVKFRMEARPRAGGGFTLDEFESVDGGPEQQVLHGTAVPHARM